MNKPVEKYTNEEEFQQLAKWWVDKLNLNNWQILFQYKKYFFNYLLTALLQILQKI